MEDGEERCQEAADYRLQAGREAFSLLGGSDGGSVSNFEFWIWNLGFMESGGRKAERISAISASQR